MTSRVADAEEDGLVLGARSGKALFTPGIPVHGVVGVLEEVGGGGGGEVVHGIPIN
jgi:hypothetical protein